MNNAILPIIPKEITVHLGNPDEDAKNIKVPFIEYIKNVASSEIYPTWPKDALKANVLAQISFALNRIYNEWYRSKGYNFDITNSPSVDQKYNQSGNVFESVSIIVDDVFNKYIVKQGQVQPLFASYCDGKTSKCDGLSQWGSFELAEDGKSYIEILKEYYGDDIYIVENAQQEMLVKSFPGYDLKLGDAGNDILVIKKQLNRIKKNYPALLEVIENEFFDKQLEDAVKEFQKTFNLPITGIIDEKTWYKIKYIYNSVKQIFDIYSEGITLEEATVKFSDNLKLNDKGVEVRVLNYYLNSIAYFDSEIVGKVTGDTFTKETEDMVKSFQKKYELEETGIVNRTTWLKLQSIYKDIIKNIPNETFYPGYILSKGMTGSDVLILQNFLYKLCVETKSIPGVKVNGVYDDLTEKSIKKIQMDNNFEVSGNTGAVTWYFLAENYLK